MRNLLRLSIPFFRYSQQERKNVINVPKIQNLTGGQFTEIFTYIQTANHCKTLAVLLRDNLQIFTDRHITMLFKHIGRYDLQIDDHFHTVIVPITMEYVKQFTRANAPTLASIVIAILYRNIESGPLLGAVLKKLDEENIYRYLNLEETASIFNLMAVNRLQSHSLMKKIQGVIVQQQKYYSHRPDLLQVIKSGTAVLEQIQRNNQPQKIEEMHKQVA